MREFPDDEACLQWLWRKRYSPDGDYAYCKRCGTARTFKRYKTNPPRPSWSCTACGLHLTPLAGTVFHKSSTSLHLWFYAFYLMTSTRCGISAKQLERELGVTYKTAWRMMNLIRNRLMAQDYQGPLGGSVEADETWIGGKMRQSEKNAAARRAAETGETRIGQYVKKRQSVFGMVERGGKVRATKVSSRYGYTLRNNIREHVLPASLVYTDEYPGYSGIERKYTHRRINHSEKVYVSGDVHTQTIEGFFSLLKNGIRGVYHSVSEKWLQGYLNEYAWRYNHRDSGESMFKTLLLRATVS